MIFIVSNKYSQYVYYPGICQLSQIFVCWLALFMLTSWLSIPSPPPLLNSCLLPVLLAYLNKMGMFHKFLLLLSLFTSIYAYNEEEEGEYLVVKPSISSFVNGYNIAQTPPSTRRPFHIPSMADLTTTTWTTTGTTSTTSTTPSTFRTTTPRSTITTSKSPSCRLSTGIILLVTCTFRYRS